MNPSDIRDALWTELQSKVAGDRSAVYHALQRFGPCTTRQLAEAMGWDVLSVRPRVTELSQLGLARCVEMAGRREGIYVAVPIEEAIATLARNKSQFEQLLLGV